MELTKGKVHFICVNVGTAYNMGQSRHSFYAERLWHGIDSHYQGDWDFTIICDRKPPYRGFPSEKRLVKDEILSEKHMDRLKKNWFWWAKITLFNPAIWRGVEGDTVVYIDLDSVIVNDLTPLTKLKGFCMIDCRGSRNPKNVFGSGVMVFPAGTHPEIYKDFMIQHRRRWPQGDQQFIAKSIGHENITPIPESMVALYKFHGRLHGPGKECIIAFHGSPKPHQLPREDWAYKVWLGKS